jgi:hypothetical protein
MGGFNIPASIDLDIVQSPLVYTSCFLIFGFVICRIDILRSLVKNLSVPPIVFSFRANPFFYLGTIRR